MTFIVAIIVGMLSGALGGIVGTWVGLTLADSRAATALRDHLREKKWLREASLSDRNITRSAEFTSSRARVKRARINRR